VPSKKNRSDLLRLIEVIQGYENLIEEYSKIELYYPRMNYKEAIDKYRTYLMKSAMEEADNSPNKAAKLLGVKNTAVTQFIRNKRRYYQKKEE